MICAKESMDRTTRFAPETSVVNGQPLEKGLSGKQSAVDRVQTVLSKERTRSERNRIILRVSRVSLTPSLHLSPSRDFPTDSPLLTEHCSSRSLTCTTPNRPRPGRPQIRFENPKYSSSSPSSSSNQRTSKIVVPSGSSCPTGFNICPVARPGLDRGYEMACFDLKSSATHCGGCSTVSGFWGGRPMDSDEVGTDCTKLVGVASSDCVDSKCRICESSSLLPHFLSLLRTDSQLCRD